MILAGDVGGTKILLEAGEFTSGRWKAALARRYMLADFASMEDVLGAFLDEWQRERPQRARITGGAIGAAGPCLGNCVTMTNRPWRLDGDKLGAHFGIPRLRLLNDLEAAAHGLDAVSPHDVVTYQAGKAVSGGNRRTGQAEEHEARLDPTRADAHKRDGDQCRQREHAR